jgi:hypothetical protein
VEQLSRGSTLATSVGQDEGLKLVAQITFMLSAAPTNLY